MWTRSCKRRNSQKQRQNKALANLWFPHMPVYDQYTPHQRLPITHHKAVNKYTIHTKYTKPYPTKTWTHKNRTLTTSYHTLLLFWLTRIFSLKISAKETKAEFQIGKAMKTNVSLKCVSLISGCLKPERIHNVGLEKLFWTRFAIRPRVTGSG